VVRREHKSPTPILIRVHIEKFLVVTKGGDTRTNLINIYFPSKIVIEILYIPMYIYTYHSYYNEEEMFNMENLF